MGKTGQMSRDKNALFWLVVSTYSSEKYERQMGLVFPIYGKI
jgi:hypothetical protein